MKTNLEWNVGSAAGQIVLRAWGQPAMEREMPRLNRSRLSSFVPKPYEDERSNQGKCNPTAPHPALTQLMLDQQNLCRRGNRLQNRVLTALAIICLITLAISARTAMGPLSNWSGPADFAQAPATT